MFLWPRKSCQVLAGLRGCCPKKDIVKKTMQKKKTSPPIEDKDHQQKQNKCNFQILKLCSGHQAL
jgi:hypothetical protein